ncbi:MAG TPA: hypothetical protein VK077_11265 [Virgibacillus sp.]|nr:hypothetical protein [Virgibacillus sp.]
MMMEFLYFPKDKSEYIPAFITLVIFMIGAVAAMYLFYKKSKKEEKYFEEKYKDEMFVNREDQHSTTSSKDN